MPEDSAFQTYKTMTRYVGIRPGEGGEPGPHQYSDGETRVGERSAGEYVCGRCGNDVDILTRVRAGVWRCNRCRDRGSSVMQSIRGARVNPKSTLDEVMTQVMKGNGSYLGGRPNQRIRRTSRN